MSLHEISATWDSLVADAKFTAEAFFDRAKLILTESKLPYKAADVVLLAGIMGHEYRTAAIGVAAQQIRYGLDAVAASMCDTHK